MSYIILNDNDKKITQPASIKIELMNHQKTMVQKMMEIEKNGIIKVNDYSMKQYNNMVSVKGTEAEISTNIAVLGDKVGAGKTLMVITLLTINKNMVQRNIELGGSQFYSVRLKSSSPLVKTNLIIVPHKLLPQWKEAFQKYSPNLKVMTIGLNKEIDIIRKVKKEIKKNWKNEDFEIESEELEINKLTDIDVILIGETMYKRFYKIAENVRFNRILIDEADTIKLPRDMNCQFNFLWLITGTPTGLFYTNKSFLGKIFKDDNLNVNSNFVIKNDDKFIEQSIKLPHPKRFKIKCVTPRELEIIKDLIPPSILQMINAGNSDQAIRTLNCNIDTNDNILQVITKNLQDSIANKRIELEAEKKKHYPSNLQKEHEQKIKFIENQIEKLINKYEEIKKKIYQLNDTNCPVCMGEFTNPVIVNCCKNMFCFDCLAVSMGELKNNKCPYCTQKITQSDIHIFQNENLVKKTTSCCSDKYSEKDKLNVLLDLVEKKPDGSFMIFAGFQETFNKIETKLKEINIPYHILKGQSSTVKKYIDDFRDKKVRILMLNAQFFGAGMNLQMATDIIMYHRFTKEMEEQIIGRAQRLGRAINEPLNVYYLLHDNESENIEDNFRFEDQKNIHYLDWLEQDNNNRKKITNINNINDNTDKIYTLDMEDSELDNYDNNDNNDDNNDKNNNKNNDVSNDVSNDISKNISNDKFEFKNDDIIQYDLNQNFDDKLEKKIIISKKTIKINNYDDNYNDLNNYLLPEDNSINNDNNNDIDKIQNNQKIPIFIKHLDIPSSTDNNIDFDIENFEVIR